MFKPSQSPGKKARDVPQVSSICCQIEEDVGEGGVGNPDFV
jgi:hypothetical protein